MDDYLIPIEPDDNMPTIEDMEELRLGKFKEKEKKFKYEISQSLVKKFYHRGTELTADAEFDIYKRDCLKKIYAESIVKTHSSLPTDAMEGGNFFETLCLGGGRGGKQTLDLPRKKVKKAVLLDAKVKGLPIPLGEKRAPHLRIEEQAMLFEQECAKRQVTIVKGKGGNVQIPFKRVWEKNSDVLLKGEMDVFPATIMYKGAVRPCIIDLKLTGDVDSTFGKYCYGTPEYLDDIQGKMYSYGIRDIDFDLNPNLKELLNDSILKMIDANEVLFFLWIFGYKANVDLKEQNKLIEIGWDKSKEAELHEDIRKTVAAIDFYNESGWIAEPSTKNCKNCPLKDECEDKPEIEKI